ncbi:MAG: exosortase U [Planctomycetota bacterium]
MHFLKTNWLLFIAAVAAHVPIGIEYAMRMWQSGHYQFFPLAALVVGYLLYVRHESIASGTEQGNPTVSLSLLGFNLLLVAFATLLNSSFVGAVSMMLLVITTIYSCHGRTGLVRAAPLLFVLLFIIPLPARIDEKLVFGLQVLASKLASWLLDGIGQVHFREGVILITEKQQFLTEEACSGVRSLFSSLAAIAIYCAINRYSWPRYLFNLVQTVGWVVLGNAVRVATVVFVTDNWSDIVASGRGHEALGILIFWFILLMAISVDHLVRSMIPFSAEHESADDDPQTAGWFQETAKPFAAAICVSAAFIMVFLVGSRMLMARQMQMRGTTIFEAERLAFPEEADMPGIIGAWQRVNYVHENRGEHNLQAEDSFIWTYRSGDLTAKVSIDCPWNNWHDLSVCYSGLGWTTSSVLHYEEDRDGPGFTRIDLTKPTGETGVVFFCSVDRNAQEIIPQFSSGFFSADAVIRQMTANLALAAGMSESNQSSLSGIALPASTFQMLCVPEREFRDGELEALEALFLEARVLLAKTSRYVPADQPVVSGDNDPTQP